MDHIFILPTGNEIKSGTVLDLDSPEIISKILLYYPSAKITKLSPLDDDEGAILEELARIASHEPDLIIIIGGSGGGHRFSGTLSRDYTHSAMEMFLDIYSSSEIYGKNGHLWCKLICGRKDNAFLINVPGPFKEASAAIKAFLKVVQKSLDCETINRDMAQAVYEMYPSEVVFVS